MNYEQCIVKSGQQEGQLVSYERLLTNGLMEQLNALKQEQL